MNPITILKPGGLHIVNGSLVLVNWKVDTGGRGNMQDCIGEVLIAVRDYMNQHIEDMMKTLTEDKFDAERIAAAKSVAEDVWRKV